MVLFTFFLAVTSKYLTLKMKVELTEKKKTTASKYGQTQINNITAQVNFGINNQHDIKNAEQTIDKTNDTVKRNITVTHTHTERERK